jgi:DNA-binding transcriptional LysR family regulator
MNYTLNQLNIFQKVVEHKSVSRASEALHLTQPAVSIQLKNFQQNFSIPLTEIVGRQLYVTEFGHDIYQIVSQILNKTDEINFKTLAFQGQLTGSLKLSIVSTAKYVMPYFISGFMNENSGVTLKMDVTNKYQVIDSLQNNEVDFSLVSILPENIKVDFIHLLPNKLHLIASNELKTPLKADFNFLKNQSLIYRELGSGTRQAMESYLIENKVQVDKKIVLTSNEAVKQSVLAGLGISIMPIIGIKRELKSNDLKIIQIKGLPIETQWYLIWLKGKKHSPIAKALLKHIETHKASIVEKHFQDM